MEFKIFTLNCWGIPFVSKDKSARMEAIASMLKTCEYDVVCLQEVWANSDYDFISNSVIDVLPYTYYFHSGVVGSGVCIFSKHRIIETYFYKWTINGYVHKVHHGDWFGGKGIGLCRIKFHDYIVNVYSTHLHAEYDRKHDEYHACRIVQAFETAQFIKLSSATADLVVLAGDLNTEPNDLAYKLILQIPQLRDSFFEMKDPERTSTNLCLRNSYTPASAIRNQIPGVRIDYILFKSSVNITVDLKTYKLPLPDIVPKCTFSYSDHEAITSTLVLKKKETDLSSVNIEDVRSVLGDCIQILDKGLKDINISRIYFLLTTIVILALVILSFFFDLPIAGLFHVIRVVLVLIMCYTGVMATLWNKIEGNSLYATKLAMEILLKGQEILK